MKEGRYKSYRTVRRMLLSGLVILLVLGVILAYYAMLYSEARQKIIARGELSAMSSAAQIDKYLSGGIDTIKLACYTLDSMIRSGKTQAEIYDFLVSQSKAVKNTSLGNSTGVYGYINGEYIDGTDWVPDDDYVATERPWYVDARANVGKVAVVDPYIDAQTNTVMITFSKTLCDAKSVAAMDYSIAPMQAIAEEIVDQGKSDVELVLDRKYQVIAHSDPAEVGKHYLEESDSFWYAMVMKLRTSDGSYFSMHYNGAEYIVYTVSTSNGWICLSVSDATRTFSQLKTFLLFTVLAILLVLAVMLFLLIRSGRQQEQFTRLSMHVVEALAAAIDAKDSYTNGHSGRVAEYAREISRRAGFPEQRQDEIYMMGLLHDVGKIGIPDSVINKPGKLTAEEYEIIKTHPATGAHILSKTKEMPRMAIGAHWHHERYDGSGYPDGLAGTAISEEARIIAVADAYDAMTSRRSYRDVLSQETVRREIEAGKGTQFDPAFADFMLQMIDEDRDYRLRGQ